MIKNKIIEFMNSCNWDALLLCFESESWKSIDTLDLLDLVNQYNLIDCIIMALKHSNYDSFLYFNEGSFIPESILKHNSNENRIKNAIRTQVLKIIERNIPELVGYIIGLDLVQYLDDEDIVSLLSSPKIDFLELYPAFLQIV